MHNLSDWCGLFGSAVKPVRFICSGDKNEPKELEDSAEKVFDAILSGKIKIEISRKYSLNDARKAHEELEARLLTGPAVIIP